LLSSKRAGKFHSILYKKEWPSYRKPQPIEMTVLKLRKPYIVLILITSTVLLGCYKNPKDNSNWAQDLTEAYAALHKERNIESANLIFEASEKMPRKNWENYFVTASIYASNNNTEKAFFSLEKAIEYGLRDTDLITNFPDFKNLKNDIRFQQITELAEKAKENYLEQIENPELLKELENMWARDQQALSKYENKIRLLDSTATYKDYQKLFKPVEKVWDINKIKLDSIITIYGWPGNKLVGEDGAKLAWAIPQHHPDVFYKERCLGLIKKAVDKGDLDPNLYAELNDRIARETWRKQTYGASMGKNAPYPINDPSNVNERRFELGLMEPIEVYAFYHGIEYTVPSEKEAIVESNLSQKKALEAYSQFNEFIYENNPDSANSYFLKAKDYYGDITNQQLFDAAIKLTQLNNDRSKRLAENILKVLIWRKWNDRQIISDHEAFNSLRKRNEWQLIEALIDKSL
tara:strand:+ start:2783 stop:4168 length:1386 start_codon:yes stop_codon:yes gene_type:complete